jgi:hypothetical protein
MRLRRFAPLSGRKTQRTGSEDRDLRRQRTDEFAALRAVQRTGNREIGFRGQGFEKTEDRFAALRAE